MMNRSNACRAVIELRTPQQTL